MSCCISSAVCCSLLTASMSGIALGYNYSLAEYIDLKETNVSVYLKRGVFDDDIADDMEWRRSGHLPISGHIKEDNLMTGSSADESTTLRDGRRLDDSIYESNDRYNFEGSLMKLTAKPPEGSSTVSSIEPLPLHEIVKKFPSNSLDQLKAVQSVINMRKMAAAATRTTQKEKTLTPFMDERNYPHFDVAGVEGSNRRAMNFDVPPYLKASTYSSLRKAVPDNAINNPKIWMLPKLQPTVPNSLYEMDYVERFTYPSPVTPRPGPLRPTRPKPMRPLQTQRTNPTHTTRNQEINLPKSIDEEMEALKNKYNVMEKVDVPSSKEDFMKKIKTGPKPSDDDYDEEIKGVPLRKKRNSQNIKLVNTNLQSNIKISVDKLRKDLEHGSYKGRTATKFDVSDIVTTTNLRPTFDDGMTFDDSLYLKN